jgi:Flp pilus assembly protein TadB
MVGALARIAKDTRRPVEDVFSAVVAEVESLGAHMPLHSGPISR